MHKIEKGKITESILTDFHFPDVEKTFDPKEEFVRVGFIDSVSVSIQDRQECLNFRVKPALSEKAKEGKAQRENDIVLTFNTKLFNANGCYPIADDGFWGYIPTWYYSQKKAKERIQEILDYDLFEDITPMVEDINNACEKLKKPFRTTLEGLAVRGAFGAFQIFNAESPLDDQGMKIYSRVLDSCKVNHLL